MSYLDNAQAQIQTFFEEALKTFTAEAFRPALLEAKELYFSQTGKVDEEDEDFETRMSSFNEWYLFDYVPGDNQMTFMKQFINDYTGSSELEQAFANVSFSLFEYRGKSFSGKDVLADFLAAKKMKLSKTHQSLPVLKGDLFIARILQFSGESYLLGAISIVPNGAKKMLSKEAKRVRKLDSLDEKNRFLLEVEKKKSKWKHYGHVEVTKIFQFNQTNG